MKNTLLYIFSVLVVGLMLSGCYYDPYYATYYSPYSPRYSDDYYAHYGPYYYPYYHPYGYYYPYRGPLLPPLPLSRRIPVTQVTPLYPPRHRRGRFRYAWLKHHGPAFLAERMVLHKMMSVDPDPACWHVHFWSHFREPVDKKFAAKFKKAYPMNKGSSYWQHSGGTMLGAIAGRGGDILWQWNGVGPRMIEEAFHSWVSCVFLATAWRRRNYTLLCSLPESTSPACAWLQASVGALPPTGNVGCSSPD